MPRTIEGARFQVGQKVHHVVWGRAEILKVDVCQHSFDDYWVKFEDGSEGWADESEMEPCE